MDCNDVKSGQRVRVARLGDTTGMLIPEKHLRARKLGAVGTVRYPVAGHGGDVWWVQHEEGGEVAAYCFDEIELATAAKAGSAEGSGEDTGA